LEAYTKQDKRVSCLFGEHLLTRYPNNPIALVEAPKTAVYGTLYFGLPESTEDFIWLAVYNKSSFSFDKLKVLRGRSIYVFPDLSKDGSTFKEWEAKAKEYQTRLPKTRFVFSDLLERLAPECDKIEGMDFADYLIKQDWTLFRKSNIQEQTAKQPDPEKVTKVTPQQNIIFSNQKISKTQIIDNEHYISQLYFENGMLLNEMHYPADWDLIGSYTEQRTKDFIRIAIKNPLVIELRKQFELI
jgi:hypothetical protein